MSDRHSHPDHHPSADLVAEYAAGAMAQPTAILVATHMALCPECRATLRMAEAVGGSLLENAPAAALADDSLERALAALDGGGPPQAASAVPPSIPPAPRMAVAADTAFLPRPLRDYFEMGFAGAPWRRITRDLSEVTVGEDQGDCRARLMRIRAGRAMPRHTHRGVELTLVLAGSFSDSAGHYRRGDVAQADDGMDHSPMADPGEDCLCLGVVDGGLRLTGPMGRWLNPFIRY